MSLLLEKSFDKNSGKWELKINGEIDVYTSPKFKDELHSMINQSNSDIVIDGENLEYIDSTGLGVLMSGLKKLREEQNNITIKNIRPNIQKLLKITGLNKIFIIKE